MPTTSPTCAGVAYAEMSVGLLDRPKPAQVRHDRPVAGVDQRLTLLVPEVAGVRPAVQQHDRCALTVVADVQADVAELDRHWTPPVISPSWVVIGHRR